MNQLDFEALLEPGEKPPEISSYHENRIKEAARKIVLSAATAASAITIGGLAAACGPGGQTGGQTRTETSSPKASYTYSEKGHSYNLKYPAEYTAKYLENLRNNTESDAGVFNGIVIVDGANAKFFEMIAPDMDPAYLTQDEKYHHSYLSGRFAAFSMPLVKIDPNGKVWLGANLKSAEPMNPFTGDPIPLTDQATVEEDLNWVPVVGDSVHFYAFESPDKTVTPFYRVMVGYTKDTNQAAEFQSQGIYNNFYIPGAIGIIPSTRIASWFTFKMEKFSNPAHKKIPVAGYLPKSQLKDYLAQIPGLKPYQLPDNNKIKQLIEKGVYQPS